MKIIVKYVFQAATLCLLSAAFHCAGGQKRAAHVYKSPEQISEEINRLNSVSYIDHSFEEPLYFGTDQRNDLRMVIIRECRNKCEETLYFLIYEGVSEKECQAIQGSALYRISSGYYLGCEPPFFTPVESVD